MNEITKLEAEFNRIENIYMQKRESLNVNNENYFLPILEYTKLSKEFTEKDCPKLTEFAEKLMIESNDETIKKTITENTANFMAELSLKIIYS